MRDFKPGYERLYGLYEKQIQALSSQNALECFVTYLKLARDYRLLSLPAPATDDAKVSLSALITAIAEYELYKGYRDAPSTEEIKKEKDYHWSKFWQLVALNMEDWNTLNA